MTVDAALEHLIIHASARELHAQVMPTKGELAELWIMRPTATALVMGSSQRLEQFDHQRLAADGIELAERRSGGGAVFIEPAATVWIDLVVPRTSRWWSNELAENFMMVGRVWQRALASFGVATELAMESTPRTNASALACWAGIGWGEVTLGAAKVVGLSQRRTRWGVRVQAMAVLDASSARVTDYLAEEHRAAVAGSIDVSHVEVLRQAGVTAADLESAVIAAFAATP